jgi:hypothetical protein
MWIALRYELIHILNQSTPCENCNEQFDFIEDG